MGRQFLVNALIKGRVLKRDGERAKRIGDVLADQRRDERGIQAAAQVRADRHIGPQPQPGGVGKQLAQLDGHLVQVQHSLLTSFREGEAPVTRDENLAVTHQHGVTGRQLADAGESRPRRQRGPKRESLGQRIRIQLSLHPRIQEQGFDF